MSFEKLNERWLKEVKRRKAISVQRKERLVQKGEKTFKKYGINKAILFGSVADDRCNEFSDIDILVMPLANEQYWAFQHELEEEIGFSVDLYTDRDDSSFVQKIIARGETVYEI